jgi:hypothetical protein
MGTELMGSAKKTEKMAGMMATQAAKLIYENAMEIGLALDKEYIRAIHQDGTVGTLAVKLECSLFQDKTLAVKTKLGWETKEKIVKESDLDMYDPHQPELPGMGRDKAGDHGYSDNPDEAPEPKANSGLVDETPPDDALDMKFYGPSYFYPTPNDGERPIGVIKGAGDLYLVGWIKDNGSIKRVTSKHLMPTALPDHLQLALDQFAEGRGLQAQGRGRQALGREAPRHRGQRRD